MKTLEKISKISPNIANNGGLIVVSKKNTASLCFIKRVHKNKGRRKGHR